MIITRMFKKQVYITDSQELKEIIESYYAIKKQNKELNNKLFFLLDHEVDI